MEFEQKPRSVKIVFSHSQFLLKTKSLIENDGKQRAATCWVLVRKKAHCLLNIAHANLRDKYYDEVKDAAKTHESSAQRENPWSSVSSEASDQ